MSETPRRTFRIPDNEYLAFQQRCAKDGLDASRVLRLLMKVHTVMPDHMRLNILDKELKA